MIYNRIFLLHRWRVITRAGTEAMNNDGLPLDPFALPIFSAEK